MMDISNEMSTAEALRRSDELVRRLTEALPVGVAQVDPERRIRHRNDQLVRIVGGRDAATVEEQFAAAAGADRHRFDEALDAVLSRGCDVETEVHVGGGEAPARICHVAMRALRDAASCVEGAVICVSDVTDSTHMRRELERRATYDPLTSCHNRTSTMAILEQALGAAARTGGTAAIFLDLDGFKAVNDALGHTAGDDLLVAVAERLRWVVRGQDVVGRIGGDEFLVVCPALTDHGEALEVAGRLAAAVANPVEVAGTVLHPRVSAGVAWARPGEASPDSLVAAADGAMYQAKRSRTGEPVLVVL